MENSRGERAKRFRILVSAQSDRQDPHMQTRSNAVSSLCPRGHVTLHWTPAFAMPLTYVTRPSAYVSFTTGRKNSEMKVI
ncbi:hypothetical protein E2C01_069631 [Portunus trituberculatus]|uniref:Uncharacterized protein n=1 Tax=Portunus trituberculatus TaxID=210409 RepID=A0A5B7I1B4_PORTR|nr:hypothetical protein [Portunus trituberculatus]